MHKCEFKQLKIN